MWSVDLVIVAVDVLRSLISRCSVLGYVIGE